MKYFRHSQGCFFSGGDCIAYKALKFCNHPGCSELVTDGYCDKHQEDYNKRKKEEDKERDKARLSSAERGYDGKWRKSRKIFLQQNPLCVECLKEGVITEATVVDHIIPHKGDKRLFWDRRNWQALCKKHHDIKTAKEDGRWG